jgi:parallel beta-helix repeat protein
MKTKKYWILVVVVGVCAIHHLAASVPAKVGVTAGPKVAADGSGTHRTIQEAVEAAAAGAVILIGPGVYEERVKIEKPLTLKGAGWEKTTIMTRNVAADKFQLELLAFSVRIGERVKKVKTKEQREAIMQEFAAEFSDKHATLLVTNTEGVIIRNLKISSPGRIVEGRVLPVPVIKFRNARAQVLGCAVIGSPGEGMRVAGGSDVEVRNCLVAAVWSTGIVVTGNKGGIAKARIQDNDVRNCHYAGIVIRPGCDSVVVKGCRISGSAWHGIRYDGASPAITGNRVFDNARSGIYASGKTAATVKNNVFYKNKQSGVMCQANNGDTIENNTFASNGREGLRIRAKCRTTIRRNIFFGHSKAVTFSSGAGLADGCRLEKNVYWENEAAVVGAEVKPGINKEIISVDPLFVDVSEKDFSLAKESPALQKGIGVAVPISFSSPWTLQPEEMAIIPDEDTRDSRKWKKPAKTKPMEGKQVGALGKEPAGDKDSDITGKEAPGFEQLLKEYKGLVSELDAGLAAYRASMPVFDKVAELYKNKFFISLEVQVQAAGARLKEFREQGHNLKSSKYNKKEAEKVVARIAGAIYRDVYSEFQKALEAGQLKITDEQEKIYYHACYFHFMTAEPVSEPFEAHYPYKKDTVEYNLFLRDLGQLVGMATSPLKKMVWQLPAELEDEKRKVNGLYEQLVKAKERSKADIPLPPKYREAYLKSLQEQWQSIRQAAKSYGQGRKTQGQK